jgi:hypothetical protein
VISDLRVQHDKAVGLIADANARIVKLTHMLADRDARIADWNPEAKLTTLPGRAGKDMVKRVDKITGRSSDGTKQSDH